MPEEPILPATLPLVMPDRIRKKVDETNVVGRDLRDKMWELIELLSRAEVDKSEAVTKALAKVARENAHLAELMRMRTAALRRRQ